MRRSLAVLLMLLLAACASSRTTEGPNLAQSAGWQWEILSAGSFELAAATAPRHGTGTLVVYLEGDGFAYVHPSQPSSNPTPTDPVALRLALAHPGQAAVAWLGRPCQYTLPDHARNCSVRTWTSGRYAPEVVASLSSAIDILKDRAKADHLVLVGYSGGGALAVLLAAKRHDVSGVVTVVANLDLGYWTKRDGLSPLSDSLDPADVAAQVAAIHQVHYAGGKDKVVGADVTRSFLQRLPKGAPAQIVVQESFDHRCCWAETWASMATDAFSALSQ